MTTPPEHGGATADELAYRLRQQEVMAAYGRFALQTHDVDALLQEATQHCSVGLKTKLAKVMVYLPDEGQFLLRAGVGWKPGVVGHARAGADAESPAGYAFQTGAPVISNHLTSESRFRTPAILAEHDVRRDINVIIQGNREPFGVLEVDSPDDGRFTEADIAFMEGMANMLGLAIERQETEDALRDSEEQLRDTEVKLRQSLADQEMLTAEISHRVKNSLTIVGSLLHLQTRMSDNADVSEALNDAQSRVQTIAQVHDRLWRANETHTVDLAAFLDELVENLQDVAPAGCSVICQIDPVAIGTDQAVSIGLLPNELVTNAFKYAYPDRGGQVRVAVETIAPNHLRFVVSDAGVGMPPGYDRENSKSLGMKLINSLGRQLGGKPDWQDAEPGIRFVLEFFPQVRS